MAVKDKFVVRLSADERELLECLVSKGKASASKITRGHILLKADANGPAWIDSRISEAFEVCQGTISRIRRVFVQSGLDAVLSRKRPSGRHYRKLDGAGEARLIALACSQPPNGKARWTLKLLADKLVELEIVETIGADAVHRTLKKMISNRILKNTGSFLPRRMPRL